MTEPPSMMHPSILEESIRDGLLPVANSRQRPLIYIIDDYLGPHSVTALLALRTTMTQIEGDVDVFLHSPGGSLSHSFQAGRILSSALPAWTALVPFQATSGATLICLASKCIVLSEIGVLGPIDPQVATHRDKDFWQFEHRSSLEAFQAMEYLQEFAISTVDLMMRLLLAQAVSPDVALRRAIGLSARLTEPVIAKVDPYALGQFQRDTQLAIEYGQRLAFPMVDGRETQDEADVEKLATTYPAHDFIIDREEADNLGLRTEAMDATVFSHFESVGPFLDVVIHGAGIIYPTEVPKEETKHEDTAKSTAPARPSARELKLERAADDSGVTSQNPSAKRRAPTGLVGVPNTEQQPTDGRQQTSVD